MQSSAKLLGPVAPRTSPALETAALAPGVGSEPTCDSVPGDFEQAIGFFVATRETDGNWDGRDCAGDADHGWF